jgi:hypothetical protein
MLFVVAIDYIHNNNNIAYLSHHSIKFIYILIYFLILDIFMPVILVSFLIQETVFYLILCLFVKIGTQK